MDERHQRMVLGRRTYTQHRGVGPIGMETSCRGTGHQRAQAHGMKKLPLTTYLNAFIQVKIFKEINVQNEKMSLVSQELFPPDKDILRVDLSEVRLGLSEGYKFHRPYHACAPIAINAVKCLHSSDNFVKKLMYEMRKCR